MKRNLKELEHRIGYTFQDFALLKKAMSHSSYVNEEHLPKYECNERLEFLGDAVLELVSSEFLFFEHPTTPEEKLTDPRQHGLRNQHSHFVHGRLNLENICFLEKERMQQEEGRENLLLLMLWRH